MKQNLRKTIGAIIINKDKKVLMCEHAWISDAFQFPQGGIEEGETQEEALKRELLEEINLKSYKIIDKMDEDLIYILPTELRKKYKKDGQTQRYFLIYFYGDDSEIKFDNQEKPEFKSFDWFELDEPVKKVVYFKKLVYLKVIEYFKKKIETFDYKK
jgi:putative (di)nucleoside polyphosphate hydrolase